MIVLGCSVLGAFVTFIIYAAIRAFLFSIKQSKRTGKWIFIEETEEMVPNVERTKKYIVCSMCNSSFQTDEIWHPEKANLMFYTTQCCATQCFEASTSNYAYCPDCGAKMERIDNNGNS